jgi:hypothetical protein
MIAMLVVGAVLLACFIFWEWKLAAAPMITKNLINNRTFLLAVEVYGGAATSMSFLTGL